MKILLRLLGGLVAVLLLLVLVAYLLPSTYRVERTIVINAKPEAVFALVGDLRRWKEWGAWQERDPAMKMTYAEKTAVVGGWSAWESKSEGSGKMTITATDAPKRVVYLLEFPEMGTSSEGTMTLTSAAGGVQVVWSDGGSLGMNPLFRWFGLFIEKIIGPDFEKGLANLKKLAEAGTK
jgi:uncharacterized protein YndB with AHSA1/START domain